MLYVVTCSSMNPDYRDFCGAFRTSEEATARTKDAGISGRSPRVVYEHLPIPAEKTTIYVAQRLERGDLFDYAGVFLNRSQAVRACGGDDYTIPQEV